jgi:hypothetical protein
MIVLTDRERQWIDSMLSYLSDSQVISIVGQGYFEAYMQGHDKCPCDDLKSS